MDVFEKREMAAEKARGREEEEEGEGQRLLSEGVTVVDFDLLCSTVAMRHKRGSG